MADLGGLGGICIGVAVWLAGARMSYADVLFPLPCDRNSGHRGAIAAQQGRSLSSLSGDNECLRALVQENGLGKVDLVAAEALTTEGTGYRGHSGLYRNSINASS